MPLDQSFVGRVYPSTEPYRVSRETIREFADAIGDPNPAYRSAAAAQALGHRDIVAPPTFTVGITMQAGRQLIDDPVAGIDYSRVVHSDQRFVHQRAVVAGDKLTVTVTVDDVRTAAGNLLLDYRCEVHDVDGALVTTTYSTLVIGGDES